MVFTGTAETANSNLGRERPNGDMETLSDVFALDHVSKGYLKTSPRVTLVPLLFLFILDSRYSRLICITTTRLEDFVSAEYSIDILMSPDGTALCTAFTLSSLPSHGRNWVLSAMTRFSRCRRENRVSYRRSVYTCALTQTTKFGAHVHHDHSL